MLILNIRVFYWEEHTLQEHRVNHPPHSRGTIYLAPTKKRNCIKRLYLGKDEP
jgi:hypothetical protein